MMAQLEAAQIASYDSNVSERQRREQSARELVRNGDLTPCEEMDQELMFALYSSLMEWLSVAENRLLLHRFMDLRARASRWYREPADAYLEAQRGRLDALLKQHEELSKQIGEELSPGCEELLQSACGDTAGAVAAFLRDETEKIETGLYAMPEKGSYLPKLFAVDRDGDASALRGAGAGSSCVTLE